LNITEKISLSEARYLFLASQCLLETNSFNGKNDLLKIIESLGYLQIDTISVVERSHHHIPWTRMPSYLRTELHELLEKDKKIFEYWSHAAAFLPIKDFRFSLIRKKNYSEKYKDRKQSNKKILRYVYDRIKCEGPLQSRDFEDYRGKTSGWWDWKPSKDALDFLFHEGKLMIAARKGFQKVYDLTERVLPGDIDMSTPSLKEFYRHLIFAAIKSNGFANEKEITYLRSHDKKILHKAIKELLYENEIIKISIDEIENGFYYTTTDKIKLLDKQAMTGELHILSPFDNLIIQRKKLKTLFNFDYQIECYLPATKRKFGYFCMPVLYGDKFLGRIDAKADRESKKFIIHNVFLEDKVRINRTLKNKLLAKLKQLSEFAGCNEVVNLKINLPN